MLPFLLCLKDSGLGWRSASALRSEASYLLELYGLLKNWILVLFLGGAAVLGWRRFWGGAVLQHCGQRLAICWGFRELEFGTNSGTELDAAPQRLKPSDSAA